MSSRYGLMDSARHVIQRILIPRFLSKMACAHRVIKRILNLRFEGEMASCDVASTIRQSPHFDISFIELHGIL